MWTSPMTGVRLQCKVVCHKVDRLSFFYKLATFSSPVSNVFSLMGFFLDHWLCVCMVVFTDVI